MYTCRFCKTELKHTLVSLRTSPLANSFVPVGKAGKAEPIYPLEVYVCEHCLLAQLPEFEAATNIFDDYAYFSSFSDSWLAHARAYVKMASERFGLGKQSMVVEIASNDGYLLQNFVADGVPCLGIEPSHTVAAAARDKGIPTLEEFFGTALGRRLASEGKSADLVIGNNVLAHVPDVNDFVGGLKAILAPGGTVTMEFPHLVRLMEEIQFDTIYHEHFSYFSFHTVEKIFAHHGLRIFDVEELPTHGGSLRIYACHQDNAAQPSRDAVTALKAREAANGYATLEGYAGFEEKVREVKRNLLEFLIEAKRAGKSVAAYGAAAKGNTLLNYCGIGTDFIDFVVDRNPYKQGRLLPGVRIPILDPSTLDERKPDYVVILPWNLKQEIVSSFAHIRNWGGKFVIPLPRLEIL